MLKSAFKSYFNLNDVSGKHSAGKALLLLSMILNKTPLNILHTLKYNSYGKPYFSQNAVHFNISNSHLMSVCCLSIHSEVGVDIEYQNPDLQPDDFETVFSLHEIMHLRNSPPREIYKLWTRKESFIKALGLNLDLNMKRINTLDDYVIYRNSNWHFTNDNTMPNYQVSICSSEKEECEIVNLCQNDKIFQSRMHSYDQ
ncbi:MAG TPA: 4'-phosphopantetheinyl transferase superfamily protein [Chitinophagales bacterium]|nr:4'-phosphopantetheinyl transferase superfamily protein [Chitinophagales bacterium]